MLYIIMVKLAVNFKFEHRSISYREKFWKVYEQSLEKKTSVYGVGSGCSPDSDIFQVKVEYMGFDQILTALLNI